MGGPHKRRPIPFRPSEGDEARLRQLHKATGEPINAILRRALAAELDKAENRDQG
jgi:hypothetical protein